MHTLTIVGLGGAAMVLLTYFATQLDWLDVADWRFPLLNLVGSLLILSSLQVQWNLPALVINSVWAAVSVFGLVKRLRR